MTREMFLNKFPKNKRKKDGSNADWFDNSIFK